jgi:hypothetical protein
MKEELTTKMHLEFCRDEKEALELRILDVAATYKHGKGKPEDVEQALKDMDLTKEQYNANLEWVFGKYAKFNLIP